MSGLTYFQQYSSVSHIFFGIAGLYGLYKAGKAFVQFDKKQEEMLKNPTCDGYVLRWNFIDRWIRKRDPDFDYDPRLSYDIPPMPFIDYYPQFALEYTLPWAGPYYYYNYGLPARQWRDAMHYDGVNRLANKRIYPRWRRLKRAVKRALRSIVDE